MASTLRSNATTASLDLAGSPPNTSFDSTKANMDPGTIMKEGELDKSTADATGQSSNGDAAVYPSVPPKRANSGLPGADQLAPPRASAHCTIATPFVPGPTNATDIYAGKTIYDFQLLDCNHELYDLRQHKGRVVLICNVASKCKEYSEQGYKTLVTLYNRYRHRGFVVIAVPCNQFGSCESGNEEDIAENIPMLYNGIGDVEFPITAKVDVNGEHELPLFAFLKSRVKGVLGSAIKWNFTSFLIDREGNPILRFAPGATIEEIEPRILEAFDNIAPSPLPSQQARTREPSVVDLSGVVQPQQAKT